MYEALRELGNAFLLFFSNKEVKRLGTIILLSTGAVLGTLTYFGIISDFWIRYYFFYACVRGFYLTYLLWKAGTVTLWWSKKSEREVVLWTLGVSSFFLLYVVAFYLVMTHM
jgi:hypothetical protein